MVLLNNMTSKLASKADLLGKLYGYLGRFGEATPAGGDIIGATIWQHEKAIEALTRGKFPQVDKVIQGARTKTFKNGLKAWLIGELAGPVLGGRNAKALSKFGAETMKWSLAAQAVIAVKWNPHGPGGNPGNVQYAYGY